MESDLAKPPRPEHHQQQYTAAGVAEHAVLDALTQLSLTGIQITQPFAPGRFIGGEAFADALSSVLAQLTQLHVLHLERFSHTGTAELQVLSTLQSLQQLKLDSVCSGFKTVLQNMASTLTSLTLDQVPFEAEGAATEHHSRLSGLRELALSGSTMECAMFSSLSKLTRLSLEAMSFRLEGSLEDAMLAAEADVGPGDAAALEAAWDAVIAERDMRQQQIAVQFYSLLGQHLTDLQRLELLSVPELPESDLQQYSALTASSHLTQLHIEGREGLAVLRRVGNTCSLPAEASPAA